MAFPDPRFFTFSGACTPEKAAALGDAQVLRSSGALIETVAAAEDGGAGALVFLEKGALQAEAGAVIVPEASASDVPATIPTVLTAASPKLAFAKIAGSLFQSRFEAPTAHEPGDAEIAASAQVAPSAVVCPGAVIGEGAVISAHAVIGHGVQVGAGSFVGPHVSITHAELGEHSHILAGARIGEPGFGFVPGPTGPFRMPQLGAVRIGNGVEIGANTTVDRGTLSDTVIGDLCKIDNLCQIAHNCRLGRGVLVASQTGISGSCVVGDFVMMGGQVGMADHLTIGRGAVLAARAGLMRDVEDGAKVGGAPAKPMRQWMKETAALSRLAAGKS